MFGWASVGLRRQSTIRLQNENRARQRRRCARESSEAERKTDEVERRETVVRWKKGTGEWNGCSPVTLLILTSENLFNVRPSIRFSRDFVLHETRNRRISGWAKICLPGSVDFHFIPTLPREYRPPRSFLWNERTSRHGRSWCSFEYLLPVSSEDLKRRKIRKVNVRKNRGICVVGKISSDVSVFYLEPGGFSRCNERDVDIGTTMFLVGDGGCTRKRGGFGGVRDWFASVRGSTTRHESHLSSLSPITVGRRARGSSGAAAGSFELAWWIRELGVEAAFRISTTRGGCYRPRAPPFHTFLHLRLAISSEPRRRPPSSPFSIPRDVPGRSACSSFFYRSLSYARQRIQARLLFVFYRLLFPISPVRLSYHYSSFVWYLQLLLRSFVRLVASSPLVSLFSLPFPVGSRPKTCFGSLALSDVVYFSSIFALCSSPLPRLQLCVSSPRSRVFRMFAGIALDRDASLFTFGFFSVRGDELPPPYLLTVVLRDFRTADRTSALFHRRAFPTDFSRSLDRSVDTSPCR